MLILARCTRYNFIHSLLVTLTNCLFSSGTPVSSTNKTDRHIITEIVLKVEYTNKIPGYM